MPKLKVAFDLFLKLAPSTLLILFCLFASSCSSSLFKKQLPATPLSVPIDISKKGNKAEIDLRIETKAEKKELEPETTAFDLIFTYHDPLRSETFWKINGLFRIDNFYVRTLVGAMIYPLYWAMEGRKHDKIRTKEEREEILADYHRVRNLLEHEELVDCNDCANSKRKFVYYPGVPLPNIRLTIISLDSLEKEIVYDEILEIKKHQRYGGNLHKFLSIINLKPGNYKVIATVESDAPEFAGTKAKILIGGYDWKI